MSEQLNGVYLIDKSSGMTSHDVVEKLRRILKFKAIGHGGTLDPLATGLLICLVGDATKLSQYIMAEEKAYSIGIKLGVTTDSGDITGKVLEEKDATQVSEDLVKETLPLLQGELNLKVPKYSAVKVKGKKLYEYARHNEDIDLPIKPMMIHEVKFISFEKDRLVLDMQCEKGTYVRSWVEELGRRLGCGATVESLRRTRSGHFNVDDALTLETLSTLEGETLKAKMVPLEMVLGGWPALRVTGRDQGLMAHGQIPKGVFSQVLHFDFKSGVRILDEEGDLLALLVRDAQVGIKLARVFAR